MVLAMVITLLPGIFWANSNTSPTDPGLDENPKATTFAVDGPYVFYKKKHILIKNIVREKNGGLVINEKIYEDKSQIPAIVCKVDDGSETSFKIHLHSEYTPPPTEYPQPDKLFAISDIEGDFDAYVTTLQGNKVIDENFQWIYGTGHLVLVGDFFDRGNNVTEVLWLTYELERQAQAEGGMVHFINGNHEDMNMRGDVRYVEDKYIQVAKKLKLNHKSLYSDNTEIGRWLRSKNVIEKIGETIFVHGGLSPEVLDYRLKLKDINQIARSNYGDDNWEIEQKGGKVRLVFSSYGPMWYRGYFRGNLSQKEVENILKMYGAERIVVGHTIVPDISGLYNGRVIGIDVKHSIALHEKSSNSLCIENGQCYALNASGKRSPVYPMLTAEQVLEVFTAVRENDTKTVQKFLTQGNEINKYYSNKQYTLLHYAIKNNQTEMVKFLIKKGADLELEYEKQTPLMYAIKLNLPNIISILVDQGADINNLNTEKKSALIYCAQYGDLNMAKLLIEKGANRKYTDQKGQSAVDYAYKHSNKAVAKYLSSL